MRDLIQTFIERTPSLQSGELINVFSKETWALPADRNSEKVRTVSLMTDLLFSSKSQSPAVHQKIAFALAQALEERLVPMQSQADVLDHLERQTPGMPQAEKEKILDSLIRAVSQYRRSGLDPIILSRCRALCTTLAESASNFTPLYLQTMGANMDFSYKPGNDTATKTWAMSMYDKLSKAMQALPMDPTHLTAANFCRSLASRRLTTLEQQRAAAEILERLVDDSHEVTASSKQTMGDKLLAAINSGTIAPELISRYKAIRVRVMQMEVVN
jgi:hypothetical protein